MFLVGNVNVENLALDSVGVKEPISVFFDLPRKSRSRRKLRVKYFGFHSGVSADHPFVGFKLEEGDTARSKFYRWRLPVGEIQMHLFAGGDPISSENVGTFHYSASGNDRNTNMVRYLTSKSCDALEYDGDEAVKENKSLLPLPVLRGHSEMSDMHAGYVEPNASQIEARFTLIPDEVNFTDPADHSFEPNIRMDTISFVLELV